MKFNFNGLIIKQKYNNYHTLILPVSLLLGTLYFLYEVCYAQSESVPWFLAIF